MMRAVKRIGKGCLYVLCGLVVAWSAFVVIGKITQPKKYPMIFGYSEANIISGSMEPTLSQGDHVIFKKSSDYDINDVVVFYSEPEGIFVVHRIVGKSNGKYITQGDYNRACDPCTVSTENIQGRVIYAIPNLQTYLYIGSGSILTLLVQRAASYIKLLWQGRREIGGDKENEEQGV